jgi:protein-S-isoprenylcysteine O-methyltransferase Ste14
MKSPLHTFTKILLLLITLTIWICLIGAVLPPAIDFILIVVSPLLLFPVSWVGRRALDKQPTPERAVWVTTFVHYGVGGPLGISLIRAITTYPAWIGWLLPIPKPIGLVLVILTVAAFLFSVANLALKGLGAPFAIALSQKVAADWMYAWTRNPMMLAGQALLLSTGIWFQSTFFILYGLLLVDPALLYFLKRFEERELELRFGPSYLEYKAKTPFFFPRKPKA